jgi:anti-sigma B factor antagonist
MEQMQVLRERGATGRTAILRLRGPLTLATLHILEDALRGAANADTVIDVGGAPYIDSAGLGAILAHWGHTKRNGCRFAMAGIHPRIALLLDITKVNTILPAFSTAEEADRAFISGRSAAGT